MLKYSLTALAGASMASAWRQTHLYKAKPFTKRANVNEDICSRAVDRLMDRNVDPNTLFNGSSEPWTDPTFGFPDAIYWEDMRPGHPNYDESDSADTAHWLRLRDVFNMDDHSLWGRTQISYKDAVQGGLGDCWVHAGASAVAQDPRRIRKMFETEAINQRGVYAVTLYAMGIPVTVTVDEFFPFQEYWGSKYIMYGKPGVDGALWMPLLEKAAAKLYGNYEMLQGGNMGPAIMMLTGAPYQYMNHKGNWAAFANKDELWTYVNDKLNAGWIVTCGTPTGPGSDQIENADGIAYMHAYTVLGAHTLSDGQRLLKIRNPWARELYFGPWSDESDLWTERYRNEVGHVEENDGIWFTTLEKYYDVFSDTQANPDVRTMHQTYWAMFDVAAGVEHTEDLHVKSDIAQTIYISGYTYNNQHIGNADCIDFTGNSYLKITHDQNCCWNGAWSGDFHFEPYQIAAGETLRVQMRVYFDNQDLRPRDYSMVVWGEHAPVHIESQYPDHVNREFPQYRINAGTQMYDLSGNLIPPAGGQGPVDPTPVPTIDLPVTKESHEGSFYHYSQLPSGKAFENSMSALDATTFRFDAFLNLGSSTKTIGFTQGTDSATGGWYIGVMKVDNTEYEIYQDGRTTELVAGTGESVSFNGSAEPPYFEYKNTIDGAPIEIQWVTSTGEKKVISSLKYDGADSVRDTWFYEASAFGRTEPPVDPTILVDDIYSTDAVVFERDFQFAAGENELSQQMWAIGYDYMNVNVDLTIDNVVKDFFFNFTYTGGDDFRADVRCQPGVGLTTFEKVGRGEICQTMVCIDNTHLKVATNIDATKWAWPNYADVQVEMMGYDTEGTAYKYTLWFNFQNNTVIGDFRSPKEESNAKYEWTFTNSGFVRSETDPGEIAHPLPEYPVINTSSDIFYNYYIQAAEDVLWSSQYWLAGPNKYGFSLSFAKSDSIGKVEGELEWIDRTTMVRTTFSCDQNPVVNYEKSTFSEVSFWHYDCLTLNIAFRTNTESPKWQWTNYADVQYEIRSKDESLVYISSINFLDESWQGDLTLDGEAKLTETWDWSPTSSLMMSARDRTAAFKAAQN